jgi:succinyl-diaminopimelate desuccinylase
MASDPVAILQDLIRCPSVTPAEGGALAYLEQKLKAAGFAVSRPVFSEAGMPDVENLHARIGSGGPHLVFAGHTDVVPPGDATRWSEPPFAGAIRDGRLIGRGAEDMKGAIACFLAATLDFLADGGLQRGSIGFLITGDEEGPAVNGTVKLIDWALARGERFDHCLLGEPTNVAVLGDMMKIGRRGSLSGTVTVRGRQGHVAYPDRAANPIPLLAQLIAAVKAAPLDAGTAHFSASNLEFTSVDVGNPATNVIPGAATARFNIRFNDLWTPDTLADEIRRRCAGVTGAGIDVTIGFEPTNAVAFLTPPGAFVDMLGAAIMEATGRRPALSTTGGTSDARFIRNVCPVVEFGLVGRSMHQTDEYATIDEINELTRIYRAVLESYFATDISA